ncbi:B3/B4 domain-containing protein [Streptomyces sp. 8N706]|uniref:B3/B4 domain-containing protein n=1 Tax=Streptomyces sp. 8N706 TaxID=3457416 RepID=UPI003FD38316
MTPDPTRQRRLTVSMSPEIAERYPECRTVLILVQGLKNSEPWQETDEALEALESEVREGTRHIPGQDEPPIAVWRDLLRSFGTNPRKARPSVDALSRRLVKSGRVPRVSPLVDTCNLVSLTYLLPTGGFDLRAVEQDITLRSSRPGDVHIPLGQPEEREQPVEGEVVYADGNRVLTRHWNHRDADSTKITSATRDAVLLLEGISPVVTPEILGRAQRELAERVTPHADSVTLHTVEPPAETVLSWTETG